MTSRHLSLVSPPTRRLCLARCVTAWILISMGMLGYVKIAWGQGERPHDVVTEIWMSGEDLAVTRRIPRDRRSAQESYDEVAQSMVKMAELRYQGGDEKTAEWLYQWALELTGGRIGNHSRTAARQPLAREFAVPTTTQPESVESEHFAPPIPDFDSSGLAIEWPISAFNYESTWDETRHIAYKSELPTTSQRGDGGRELVSEQETEFERSANGMGGRDETRSEASANSVVAAQTNSGTQPSRRSELVVKPLGDPLADAPRQVAVASTTVQQGVASHLHHAAPAAPTEQPMTLALSCFAAGVACCFVLHMLLLLTPIRLTLCRPSNDLSRALDDSSAQATPSRKTCDPVRRVPFSARPPTAARSFSQQPDQASSMVEEFYKSNIELFERCAQLDD